MQVDTVEVLVLGEVSELAGTTRVWEATVEVQAGSSPTPTVLPSEDSADQGWDTESRTKRNVSNNFKKKVHSPP